MRAVVQRLASAKVTVDGETRGAVGIGILILLGIKNGDTEQEARWVADKCLHLRVFQDEQGKMNRSVLDLKGEIMVVSQFTLYGDTSKGRRPGFVDAAPPRQSEPLYEFFLTFLRENSGLKVEKGVFGAKMQVDLINDGPVTLIVEKDHEQ